ncbi:MAG: L,D-transpeptidase family protein [Pseudomonadota bacterium]
MRVSVTIASVAALSAALAWQPPAPAAAQTTAPAAAQTTAPAAARTTAPAASAADLRLAASADPSLGAFYGARDWRPMWTVAGGVLSPTALLDALEQAGSHALPAAAYGGAALRARVRAAEAAGAPDADLEIALSRTLARYAADLSAGALKPNAVDRNIHRFPVRPEAAALLAQAAAAPDLNAWLDARAPQDPGYARLRALYADLAAQAKAGGWRASLAEGGTLRPGDRGPRVAQLRARLAELGDAPAPAEEAELFDPALEVAVKEFQRRHGLNADGLAGRRTFAALGADAGERFRQAAVNLERMRWMREPRGARHIYVNIADYRMQLVEHGKTLFDTRVVVGKRRHQTVEFSDEMEYMVVNPTWHVPRSIANQEILPKLQENPNYLVERNMRLVSDGGVPADTTVHDWSQYAVGSFPYRVKQRPGLGNALGRVKFMFPNRFSIYLHDTPSKSLFKRDARSFSHGCVRVENPFEFAHALLAPQLDDPEGAFQAWLDKRTERYVHLNVHVPVHLDYRTVWVDEAGTAQFRADVYGRDARVWTALESAGLSPGL